MPKKKLTNDELIKELDNARRLLADKDEELTAEAARRYDTVRDQSRTLDAFFDNTITPLAILDRDFNFVMVNPAYARAGKREISEFEGNNYFKLYPSGTKEIFNKVVATKKPYQAVARPFKFPDQPERETTYWDWTLVPILDRDKEVDFLVFSLVEVTERKRAEIALTQSHALLNALDQAQASYISDTSPNDLFDKLLGQLLEITRSEYGFIGQVLEDEKGKPYLKNFATTNIAWNKETKDFYEKHKKDGLEFNNMDSLFGLVITTGKPIISNDAPNDKRGCGIPKGHPPLNAFLGLPCYIKDKLVGMVAFANRPEGYDEEVIELLSPLLSTTANIIEAYRNDILRRETKEALEESEKFLSTAQEIAHLGHWKLDPATNEVTGSNELYRIFGIKKEGSTLESFIEMIHPDDKEFNVSTIQRGIEKGQDWDIEHRLVMKDGTEKTVHAIGNALTDETGKVVELIGTVQDITERKKIEDVVKTERERLFSILDSFPGFVYLQAEDYSIPFANKRFIDHYGDPTGKSCHELMWDREKPCDECKTFDVFKTKEPIEWISDHPSQGSVYQVYDHPFIDTDGTFLVLELSIDITKRMEAEKELQNYKIIFDNMTDMAYMLDNEGTILYLNEPFERLSGFKVKDFIGSSFAPLFEGINLERAVESFTKTIGGEALTFELEFKESGIVCEYSSMPLKDLNGRIIGACGTARDVTEKRLAKEKLRKSEERFRDIAENAKVWIWEADKEGRYTYASPMVEKILGYKPEEMVGRYFHEFVEPDKRDIIKEELNAVFDSKKPFLNIITIKIHKTGDIIFCESSGIPIIDGDGMLVGYRGSVSDITERKIIEADRLKMQKLESIGVLAGGIAHDFNNLLTGILGNISFSMMSLDPKDKIFTRLKEAERASLIARDLTQQLLTFSKGGEPVMETHTIESLIKEPAELALRGSNNKCEFKVTDDLPCVEADTSQMSQVINNLIINADQAMPEGGVINVSARKKKISTNDHLPVKDGDYILIQVEDHGTGISAEHIAKIFDPYFTTKQKGSGLGLASVYSIVVKHGGHVEVHSEIGKGSIFSIYLPASKKKTAPKDKNETKIIHGHGRVLVMDDEEIIRDLLSEFLVQLGYEVLCVTDGAQAIKAYREAKDADKPFKAVIMDLTIQGGMGGKETIKKLLKIDPEAKVIVSSGYSNDPVVSNYRKFGFNGYLNKPYKVPTLSKVLDDVINGREE